MTTWTPVGGGAANSWTEEEFPTRGFDPAGFDNTTRFDTGSSAGVWSIEDEPSSVWTPN